ncbi:DMT family transporter [Indiicoccus explosivorum]|uniref:DMT family transporter n=1 Tax=Indiicoccus explosivorum TaxID=1917864 RepID=UPI00138FF17B|nr:DMT family transporter [Indiicoccus explosivorum]
MKKGIAFLVLATMLWGGNYICGRFLADALPPTLLNTIRWAISSVLLWAILLVKRKSLPLLSMWKEFFILGFFGVFAFSTLVYAGLQSISASSAGMITAGIPVAILLFTPLILKEKISMRAWIGTGISIFGVILLFQGMQGRDTDDSFTGQFAILLACIAWALYTVYGKYYGRKTDPLTLTAGAAVYGTVLSAFSCIGTVDPQAVHLDAAAILAILYVSTFASVIAYLAWNAGVRVVGAGTAAPFINLLPVWTVVFGLVLLNEELAVLTLAGGIITITGALLASYRGTAAQGAKRASD